MNQSPNDHYSIAQNNLYPQKDFRPIVSPVLTHRKPYNPYPQPMLYSKPCLFVADWQLPGVEYNDVNKSHS